MDLAIGDAIVILALVFFAGTLAFIVWNALRR